MASIPPPLVTPDQFQIRYPAIFSQISGANELEQKILEATSYVEQVTQRRLAPFTGLAEEHPLFGIDPDEFSVNSPDMPLPWAGSLGSSYANSLGASNLVRQFWLDQCAPHYPELWTYEITAATVYLSVGGTVPVQGNITEGPWPETGKCRLMLGTFAPDGSTIAVTYNGGYSTCPLSLQRLVLAQTALFAMEDLEPEKRKGLDSVGLERTVTTLMAVWGR